MESMNAASLSEESLKNKPVSVKENPTASLLKADASKDAKTPKKTKISVWLLKDDAPLDKLFGDETLKFTDIKGVGKVYKSQIPLGSPAWVETFFDNKIDGLTKGGAGAILLTEAKIGDSQKYFLVSFGLGFHKINPSFCEGRFGLKIVLNAGDLKHGVRSLDKRNLSSAPRLSREQASKHEDIATFGIDFEQDILHSLSLASLDDDLGASISGSTSLSMTTAYTIQDIQQLLPKLYGYYRSEKYKKEGYEWVDHVSDAPKKYTADLNTRLVQLVNDCSHDNQTCYFSPPEIVDYDDIIGFAPSPKKSALIKDEIVLDDYRTRGNGIVQFETVEEIKARSVHIWSAAADHAIKHWSLYRCINMQIEHDGHVFVLSDGKWYMVSQAYSTDIDAWYKQLPVSNSSFGIYKKAEYINKKGELDYKHSEEEFNKVVAATNNFACLDRDLIDLGYRKDIEACDLYKTNEFMHVKIFTGASAPISHLLAQATVSAELFFGDEKFREELNKKLPESMKLNDSELKNPTRGSYKVKLGVITNRSSLLLPFFSKINLRSTLQRLQLMNLHTEVVYIKGEF